MRPMRWLSLSVVVLVALCGVSGAEAKKATDTKKHGGVEVTRVDGVAVEVHTAKAYRAMAKAARKAGVTLGIRSGYRTYAQQEHLYKLYLEGKGNPAAPPGMSNHENGRALDLKLTDPDAARWLKKHAERYGFRATVPGEPWHWEYDATARAKRGRTHAH
jgi:LAS superfamily LD-carboxypeptidase LdcB